MHNESAMIYSAMLGGHRQLHCDVFTDLFLNLGYKVLLVVGLNERLTPGKWLHIERYRSNPDVTILDTVPISAEGKSELSITEIVNLQIEYQVGVTLFPYADASGDDFNNIYLGKSPRLKGWNIGYFGLTQNWYPLENPLEPMLSPVERYRATKRVLLPKSNPDRVFFEEVLANEHILDKILVKDERVAKAKGDPFFWFPDIYRPFEWDEVDGAISQEYQEIIPLYQEFLKKQGNKQVLLFFGVPTFRKGYHLLLNLAFDDPDTCFVHCGSPYEGDGYTDCENYRFGKNVNQIKSALISAGRYYETGRRLENWHAIDFFWNSIEKFISTHLTYGSSGTVLHAMEKGKPVLLPDRGFFHYLNKEIGVGMGYQPQNSGRLLAEWLKFKKIPNSHFASNLENYISQFSKPRLMDVLRSVLP